MKVNKKQEAFKPKSPSEVFDLVEGLKIDVKNRWAKRKKDLETAYRKQGRDISEIEVPILTNGLNKELNEFIKNNNLNRPLNENEMLVKKKVFERDDELNKKYDVSGAFTKNEALAKFKK